MLEMSYKDLYDWQEEGSAIVNMDTQRIWTNIELLRNYGVIRQGGDPNLPILCAGCRTGYELHCFDHYGYKNVHGFDWSRKMVAVSLLTTAFDIRHDDIMNIRTFPESSFGVVYCSHVIEHIRDPKRGISNLGRLLTSDGVLVIVVPKEPELPSKYHVTYFRSLFQLTDCFEGLHIKVAEEIQGRSEFLVIAERS